MHNIFVYGTLQSPEIIKKLTGKLFKSKPAVLVGYKRYCIKNSNYPAIIQQDDSKTLGLLIENMDDLSLSIISFYEGEEYEKKKVTVNSNEKSEDVLTFVWVQGIEFLENKDWDLDNFEKTFLEHYLEVVIPETLKEFHRKH
jgi:gamma-glutamylcyclotransferase (GGCT)/AIG2-like uncharacterized protein YtfP